MSFHADDMYWPCVENGRKANDITPVPEGTRATFSIEYATDLFDAATIDSVVTMVDRAEWKRRQTAPGPKISPVAFGRDRRLPITSRWREDES